MFSKAVDLFAKSLLNCGLFMLGVSLAPHFTIGHFVDATI